MSESSPGYAYSDDRVKVIALSVGPYDNNVYLVACARTDRAVIVDAAADGDRILAAAAGLTVEAILTTHGHQDHIQAIDRVQEELGIPWLLHPDDFGIAGRRPDRPLADGDEIVVGEIALHTIHTPGHTPGSVSFVIEPVLLSGDTLFPGGPGATRWEYSSFGSIMDSISERLLVLPEPTLVYPGHGRSTTIGEERPHLDEWRNRGW